MKNFQFHLQKILDLKEKEKEQAEWAFGKSVQKKNEEETKLYQLTELRNEVTESLYSIQSEPRSISELMQFVQYQQSVDKKIESQRRTVNGCEQEIERCQTRLTFHMTESKLWNRLKEKARESFDENIKQREQKELDEIGINRYLRRATHR
ncbi:flagellar export protein FliJ [Brevibacillus sp. SYSU BS000544]|uniref:flagellar export protein FliJ n=1 Tax=Brevibacillus sp. SYSU BS000544 TaxID=3416443 RepID=UPI003CE46797